MAEQIFIARQDTLEEIGAKVEQGAANIGQTADTGGSTTAGTVMAKLNALQNKSMQVFKSWKRYTYSNTDPYTSVEIPIQQVDASRCFVLVERTGNSYNQLSAYGYTLEDTKIRLFHRTATTGYIMLAFTVIELY